MNTHPLDKYTAAALDVIDQAVERWNKTGRDHDNPRWLIASPRGYATGTAQIQSSQLVNNPGAKVWALPIADSAWNTDDMGGQWFRALKHAYLDALNIQGGMPRNSAYRGEWNRVMGISEHAHELIKARIAPQQAVEPPATVPVPPTVKDEPTPSKLPAKLAGTPIERAALRWMNERGADYDNGAAGAYSDLCRGGCASGMVGDLIYYTDTLKFYTKHRREITALLTDAMDNAGASGPAELFGDKWDKADPFATDIHNRSLLAWFGFEEAANLVAGRAGL